MRTTLEQMGTDRRGGITMRFLRWSGVVNMILPLASSEAAAAAKSTAGPGGRGKPHRSAATIDNTAHMDANNLDMVVTNHGSFAYDLLSGNAGLIYPKGSTKTAVFAAGPWLGAKVGAQVRIAVGEYSQEFTPRPMAGGTFSPTSNPVPRYKNLRGQTTRPDYPSRPLG